MVFLLNTVLKDGMCFYTLAFKRSCGSFNIPWEPFGIYSNIRDRSNFDIKLLNVKGFRRTEKYHSRAEKKWPSFSESSFQNMNQLSFCSRSSVVVNPIKCVYGNDRAEGSSPDKRLVTEKIRPELERYIIMILLS